jgi:hypothetical protein
MNHYDVDQLSVLMTAILPVITLPFTRYPLPTMSQNAQQSFRSQLSGFRWANSVQDDSATTAQNQGNVFSRTWTGLSGYVPLRNEGRSQEEEAYFALSVSRSLIHLGFRPMSGSED